MNHHIAIEVVVFTVILCGCKKEKTPVVSTIQVTDVTETAAIIGGDITDSGC